MTKTIARKDAIMVNIALMQSKMIELVSQYSDDDVFNFVTLEDGDFHFIEIKNETTGAVLTFAAPRHPQYFTEVEDALPS